MIKIYIRRIFYIGFAILLLNLTGSKASTVEPITSKETKPSGECCVAPPAPSRRQEFIDTFVDDDKNIQELSQRLEEDKQRVVAEEKAKKEALEKERKEKERQEKKALLAKTTQPKPKNVATELKIDVPSTEIVEKPVQQNIVEPEKPKAAKQPLYTQAPLMFTQGASKEVPKAVEVPKKEPKEAIVVPVAVIIPPASESPREAVATTEISTLTPAPAPAIDVPVAVAPKPKTSKTDKNTVSKNKEASKKTPPKNVSIEEKQPVVVPVLAPASDAAIDKQSSKSAPMPYYQQQSQVPLQQPPQRYDSTPVYYEQPPQYYQPYAARPPAASPPQPAQPSSEQPIYYERPASITPADVAKKSSEVSTYSAFVSAGFDAGFSRLDSDETATTSPAFTADIAVGLNINKISLAFDYMPVRSDGSSLFNLHALALQFGGTFYNRFYGIVGIGYLFGNVTGTVDGSTTETKEHYYGRPYTQLGIGYTYPIKKYPVVLDIRYQHDRSVLLPSNASTFPSASYVDHLFRLGATYVFHTF